MRIGGIVDELALAKALKEREFLAQAWMCSKGEPKVIPELLALKNVVLAPHMASATEDQKSDDSVSDQKLFGWFEWSNATKIY